MIRLKLKAVRMIAISELIKSRVFVRTPIFNRMIPVLLVPSHCLVSYCLPDHQDFIEYSASTF
jgi:hypothetical protein